jgi:predicted nucleotide-binding protein
MAALLKVSKKEAEEILSGHRDEGQALVAEALASTQEGYEAWERRRRQWIDISKEALTFIYAADDEADEFYRAASRTAFVGGMHWAQDYEFDHRETQAGVDKLQSLIDRLRYAAEPSPVAIDVSAAATEVKPVGKPVIFLVHGRDHGTRETVARFLEKAGSYDVVILDEQADEGNTLVEKFEEHAKAARYAVVLLTGDDVGGVQGSSDQQSRARQNVVFELGWFFGQLGRKRVSVLCADGVERPSDIAGLVYIPLDHEWKVRLVRNLNAAGVEARVWD